MLFYHEKKYNNKHLTIYPYGYIIKLANIVPLLLEVLNYIFNCKIYIGSNILCFFIKSN